MAVKAKHQRLVLAALALVAVVGAGVLASAGLSSQAAFFYTPSDAAKSPPEPGRAVRLGGMVETGSLKRATDGVTQTFVVADQGARVPVRFRGIAPDLFREGSGVVAEGRFESDGSFTADSLLAKHDERYMPPQVAGAMHKSESLKP